MLLILLQTLDALLEEVTPSWLWLTFLLLLEGYFILIRWEFLLFVGPSLVKFFFFVVLKWIYLHLVLGVSLKHCPLYFFSFIYNNIGGSAARIRLGLNKAKNLCIYSYARKF